MTPAGQPLRRRHHLSAAYSTSFLDLCCCALGGMILLMVLLIPAPRTVPVDVPTRVVKLGLRFPVVLDQNGPVADWPASDSARLLIAARSVDLTVFSGPAHQQELRLSAADVERLVDGGSPVTRDGQVGTVAVTARRSPRLIRLDLGPRQELPPDDTPAHRHAVLEIAVEFGVPETSPEWPLLVGLRASVVTPRQAVPRDVPRLLAALGRDWEALKLTVPAPPERDVPTADVFAAARVEPQAAEARAALPRLGVLPSGRGLTFSSPRGWKGPGDKLADVLRGGGFRVSGTPPAAMTLEGEPGPPGELRVDLYAVARVSLSPPDARGRSVPQIDHFGLASSCPCGHADCPFPR